MLKGAENSALYREWYETVQAPDARLAFFYLVGWASSLKNHECYPTTHGVIKDFRFMRGVD